MNKSRKRMRSVMLLTTVALAGSAGATFNFSFGASGGEARPPQEGINRMPVRLLATMPVFA